jgi:hypothetical protein
MGAQMPYQPNSQRRKRPYVLPLYFNVRNECGPIADGVAWEFHNFEAATMVKVFWFDDPIPGQKRKDDLFL